MSEKPKILFLCTGNSCRSQMAEGFARSFKGNDFEAFSAGIIAAGLDPYAVRVMKEVGVDISKQQSKTVDAFVDTEFDYVVTVCDDAAETCPFFPAKTKVVHHGFDDPPRLAATLRFQDEKLECYRRVRDKIRTYVDSLPESLEHS